MNEVLLQFIWQYSLYNPVGMHTADGASVTVIHPGKKNTDAGPDFAEARIKIGNTTLVGNVELHIHSSDWHKHRHSGNQAYSNIILHVVFINDAPIEHAGFATLEIGRHIPAYVIDRYTNLIQTTQPIACARQLTSVSELHRESWLNRLLAERWEQKLGDWQDLLEQSSGDWRNLLYWRLAANFGFKTNAAPFLLLARSLPLNILARHKDNLQQVEALLFGQAGMLGGSLQDEYQAALHREYLFLQQKYKLTPVPGHLWKFLRMRPANFPTVRIAQFAVLVHRSVHLFSKMIEAADSAEVQSMLRITADSYWDTHYRFGEPHAKVAVKSLGNDAVNNIVVNTVAPIQFLYAHYHGNMQEQEKALQLLASVPAEQNSIISLWEKQGWTPRSAAQSQALIQLFNNYCSNKRCLQCAIGLGVIKANTM